MDKKLLCRVDSGLEALIRVVGLLKRKRFDIRSVNLEEIENSQYSNLEITLKDGLEHGIKQAINQMEKLVNVYDIREIN
ncbi:ACT domain-containing protein [Paramaledivibacter caminithermalis]|uniref:Acetolactate synthase, small subunit n=1 Tax=Paramaledivibacter caminithermalis (strain DSM 15212 / CIP 107654 / DViRD3) TaxID=1121301 RepID=A0A1M6KT47_PARC5|nr:ACT domain-containing protein [Paramaledivibacter caminithermalis]SHJ62099.1 acetolactate synthase, small subunit [Paramaledivibacter caminithermalis DSM 15212]